MAKPRIQSLGWRIFLAFVVFLVLANVFTFAFLQSRGLKTEPAPDEDAFQLLSDILKDPNILASLLLLQAVAGTLTVIVMAVWIDRRPLVRPMNPGGWLTEAAWGLALGFILASVVALFIAAVAARHLRPEMFSATDGGGVGFLAFVILAAAFMEELMFRGYLYRIIRERHGAIRTIVLTSLAFSALHITNPGSSLMAWLNILLMGIVLGQLRELTGKLGMPFGLHVGWNLALGMLFGVPVSGMELPSAFRIAMEDLPQPLSGGEFGPEASVVLTTLFSVVIGLLARRMMPRREDPV